jgi:hypothetical protein
MHPMNSETGMKRSSAVRKAQKATNHNSDNPFCAAHPDLSAHGPSAMQSDPETVQGTFRRTEDSGLRAHVRADHVVTAKKRK